MSINKELISERITEILQNDEIDNQTALENFVANAMDNAKLDVDGRYAYAAVKEHIIGEINDMLDDEETRNLDHDEEDEVVDEFADRLDERYCDLLQENFDRMIKYRQDNGEL